MWVLGCEVDSHNKIYDSRRGVPQSEVGGNSWYKYQDMKLCLPFLILHMKQKKQTYNYSKMLYMVFNNVKIKHKPSKNVYISFTYIKP